MDVFVSVGTGLTVDQEAFVSSIEARLKAEGFTPCTVGRNFFSVDAPLKAVEHLMERCSGTVIIALVRYVFPVGSERPGAPQEHAIANVRFPTIWNQIEASMAYRNKHPLLVIADERLRADGMLESGNDWYVQRVPIERESLNTASFNGIFADWRDRVKSRSAQAPAAAPAAASPADLSVREMLSRLRPGELWKVIAAVAAVIGVTFAAGTQVGRLMTVSGSAINTGR